MRKVGVRLEAYPIDNFGGGGNAHGLIGIHGLARFIEIKFGGLERFVFYVVHPHVTAQRY